MALCLTRWGEPPYTRSRNTFPKDMATFLMLGTIGVRHGSWDNYLAQMTHLVTVLIDAGADVNTKDKGYPSPKTHCSSGRSWNLDGGMIRALLAAGTDLNGSFLSGGDTVLHSWVAIVRQRLNHPESYLPMKRIVEAMPNIDIPNRFEEDTPLHLLSTTSRLRVRFSWVTPLKPTSTQRPVMALPRYPSLWRQT